MIRVLYGGTFDLLHWGHVKAIERAKSFGDYLIVNVSSDKQTQNKKGISRPIIPENERIEIVSAIKWINKVICMHTATLDLPSLLDITRPDVVVTNDDNHSYDAECESRKIKVVKLPRIIAPSGLDTTTIITKIEKGVMLEN